MTKALRRKAEDTDTQGYQVSRLTAKLGIGSVRVSQAQRDTIPSMSSRTHTHTAAPGILPKSNIRKQESFPVVQRWEEMTSLTVIHPDRYG